MAILNGKSGHQCSVKKERKNTEKKHIGPLLSGAPESDPDNT